MALLLASASAALAAPASVTISNAQFLPQAVTVNVGEAVTWTNTDAATHTATSDTNAFDTRNLATGQSRQVVFGAAGTFPYHCAVHPVMRGTVVVRAATTPAPPPPTPPQPTPAPTPAPTPVRTQAPTAAPRTPAPATAAPPTAAPATAAPTATPVPTATGAVAASSPTPSAAASPPTAPPAAATAEGQGQPVVAGAALVAVALTAIAAFLAIRR